MRDDSMCVRLDIVSDPGLVVLRRLDGTEMACSTARGATCEEILRVGEADAEDTDEA